LAILSVLAEPGAAQSTFGSPTNVSTNSDTEYRYGRFRFNTGFEWNEGNYGSSSGDTTRWYVPFTLGYSYQQWKLNVTVPYVNVSSPGNVIGAGGGGVVIDNKNQIRVDSNDGEIEVDNRGRGGGNSGPGGGRGGRGRNGADDVVQVGGATVVDPCSKNQGKDPTCPEDNTLAGVLVPQALTPAQQAAAAAANTASRRNNESGLGDVIAGITYSYDPGQTALPFVDLTFKVKFPTADENKGLGTGAFDYILQADIDKTFGKFTPLARIGYRWNGDLEIGRTKLQLNDVIFASLGGQYAVMPTINIGASVDYYEAASAFADDAVEVYSYVRWRATRHVAASLYGIAGLTDGSPDQGVGVQLSFSQ
jgi:hypothetical protein